MTKNSLSSKLKNLIKNLPDDKVTVLEIKDALSKDGMFLLMSLLTIVFLIPISIPGVSTIFGGTILLISISLILDKELWLPSKISKRELSAPKLKKGLNMGLKWFIRLEKIAKTNRLSWLTNNKLVENINYISIILGTLLLMMPFGLIPFSNTLPAIAILCFCIGIMEKDGLIILLGHIFNIATIIYFAILISGGGYAIYGILKYFQ